MASRKNFLLPFVLPDIAEDGGANTILCCVSLDSFTKYFPWHTTIDATTAAALHVHVCIHLIMRRSIISRHNLSCDLCVILENINRTFMVLSKAGTITVFP